MHHKINICNFVANINFMITEFSIGNFRSFKDIQTVHFQAAKITSKYEHLDKRNVFTTAKGGLLLKSKVVYGANASGKSNLVKAVEAMLQIIKQSFKDETHMMSLIKEDYKVDGNTFLMTDGNETYKVRWEGDNTLGEGVVLQYQNKERINEDKENMKKLYNYKKSDVVGKTNNYINESIQFKKMMDVLKGNK